MVDEWHETYINQIPEKMHKPNLLHRLRWIIPSMKMPETKMDVRMVGSKNTVKCNV